MHIRNTRFFFFLFLVILIGCSKKITPSNSEKTGSTAPIAKKIAGSDGVPIENPDWDKTGEKGIADYREKALFAGMLGSFSDAQGGLREELREISLSFGAEYWYDKQFAFRCGYYWESAEKGNRRFFTVGAGIKYNVFGIDLSYLVPTSNLPNPLDNTLRFSLLFDFSVFTAD